MSVQETPEDLDRVRIPPEVMSSLRQLILDLKLRILNRAAQKAASNSDSEHVVMQIDELLEAARQTLVEVAGELNDSVAKSEFQHVRRAC